MRPAEERARRGAGLEEITIRSDAVGRDLPVEVVTPDGEAPGRRPMLVFLHGRAVSGELASLHGEFYDALDDAGDRAPVVAFPNGDVASYWHNRADGDWETYVTDEVIPQVAKQTGADPNRVAIGGISMGGFGALDIARLHPGRFCAVGGHSPALWQSGGETAPGAFDDAEDFARHDVIGTTRNNPDTFAGAPIWIDGGQSDPFQPGIRAFTAALRSGGVPHSLHSPPGAHEGDYWRSHWDEYMDFYADALRGCRR